MKRDALEREYGILLALTGPTLLERADTYRRLAQIVGNDTPSGRYLLMQADRAEETIVNLGRKLDDALKH